MNIALTNALKQANVSIHVAATGAGAGIQSDLWVKPGASAYLSGASFPYAMEEQEELLGFMPQHFCSPEASVDLASAAYMKAFKNDGKNPVGLGITASVTSDKPHRGDHRFHISVITNDQVKLLSYTLHKYEELNNELYRVGDGEMCDQYALHVLLDALGICQMHDKPLDYRDTLSYQGATELAHQRFFERPFFTGNGERLPLTEIHLSAANMAALMPGAFNPPHEGHIGIADQVKRQYHLDTVFEICAAPPHKEALSIQQLLQRAKLLRGFPVAFTHNQLYLDKAKAFPNTPIIVGADAMVRMLDPKWGTDIPELLYQFNELGTQFYVASRKIDGELVSLENILPMVPGHRHLFHSIDGHWDISSTEIRNKP